MTKAQPNPADEAHDRFARYLNEHLLGSEGGLRAFHAATRTWEGTPHEAALRALTEEVAQDRRDLARIIQSLGYRPAPWKRMLTGAAAAFGHLGPTNLLRSRHGSMAQLELDTLTGAVRAKLSMWDAMLTIQRHDARLDRGLLEELKRRAEHQIAELQRIAHATCVERFATTAQAPSDAPRTTGRRAGLGSSSTDASRGDR